MSDDLKTRVAVAAKQSGKTPHGFMLEAIAEMTGQAELCAQFDTIAEERYARIVDSGKTVSWESMRCYLAHRIRSCARTNTQPA